ncbi:hypothetical protein [Sphingobacterium paludis]|uniref:Uncharacterized protein n=1 Tax=Sphingobacterium paludis TaxID=1476465 RepID=A0A4R7D508_9SPHI|nr:hypothetical protein [Sphingobacterium paludis]TDS13956.1 hypothetical protein B0I21_104284 [Sphingobacterium paludis]
MKKNLLLTLAIGMAFVACKKAPEISTDPVFDKEKYVVVNDSTYDVSILKAKFAKFFSRPVNEIGYNSALQYLYIIDHTGEFPVDKMISTLNTIDL